MGVEMASRLIVGMRTLRGAELSAAVVIRFRQA